MKKSNLNFLLGLLLIVTSVTAFHGCKKSSDAPDPNLSIVVKRQLVVSVLNAFTNDSIGQFNVSITTPSSTISQVSTGNTFVVPDPVAGSYTIVVSKTGYTTSNPKVVTVVLPTDPKASLKVDATLALSKAATAVAVTTTAGATIPVKANAEVPSSATVANVTVAASTAFTLADGTKPTTVNISVTNVPVNAALEQIINSGGSSQIEVGNIEVIKDQIPVKSLDLQPEGLTFDKPMIIDMYIGDLYPSTMPLDVKILKQDGLTLNYVKKDGTVEVLKPDHFSTDRNTVYYKVTHFSKWNLLDGWLSIKQNASTLSPLETKTGSCGQAFSGSFEYTTLYKMNDPADPYRPWLLTGVWADAKYTVKEAFTAAAQANYYAQVTWQVTLENWTLTDTCPGFWQTWRTRTIVIPIQGNKPLIKYIACHNQGG